MDLLHNIAIGFSSVLTPENLMYSFIGVFLGNVVGVLPGVGPLAAISMVLPMTYTMGPEAALMMLAGLYYGAQYGGATTAILLNLPGIASHAVTCLDGHPLAQQGKASSTLFIAMIASFFGATIGIILMMMFSPIISELALEFGAADYFSIILLGLLAAATLSQGSAIKGLAMVALGLMVGIFGIDVNSGLERFTFGIHEMGEGISLVALAVGIFGIADILQNINKNSGEGSLLGVGKRTLRPEGDDLRKSALPALRGAGIGSILGILPGVGSTVSAFMSYAAEKRVNRGPVKFGEGAIQGVAGPEAANNAAAQTSFIPTMSLGIPGDAVMALMLGALLIQGIQPGPQMIAQHPTVFWGLIASFWIGNLLLLILNVPLIGLWVRFLSVPYRLIYPAILFFICMGVYSVQNSMFDVGVAMVCGVIGFIFMKFEFERAPLLLGFVLGPLLEEHFRRALILSRGDFLVFAKSPISATVLLIALALVVYAFVAAQLRHRHAAA